MGRLAYGEGGDATDIFVEFFEVFLVAAGSWVVRLIGDLLIATVGCLTVVEVLLGRNYY